MIINEITLLTVCPPSCVGDDRSGIRDDAQLLAALETVRLVEAVRDSGGLDANVVSHSIPFFCFSPIYTNSIFAILVDAVMICLVVRAPHAPHGPILLSITECRVGV